MGKPMKYSLEDLISINGDEKEAEGLRKYFKDNQKSPGKLLGVFVNETKEEDYEIKYAKIFEKR